MAITLIYTKSFSETQKYFKHMVREVNKRVARKWLDDYFPKRFTENAVKEYNFSPRTKKYEREKSKKYGHNKNLVFSGQSKQYFDTQYTERSTFRQHTIKWSGIPEPFKYTGRIRPTDDIDVFILNHPSNRAREIAIDLQKEFKLKPNEISYKYIYRVRQGMGRVLQKGNRKMPNIAKEITATTAKEVKELNKYAVEQLTLLMNETDAQKKARFRKSTNGGTRT